MGFSLWRKNPLWSRANGRGDGMTLAMGWHGELFGADAKLRAALVPMVLDKAACSRLCSNHGVSLVMNIRRYIHQKFDVGISAHRIACASHLIGIIAERIDATRYFFFLKLRKFDPKKHPSARPRNFSLGHVVSKARGQQPENDSFHQL